MYSNTHLAQSTPIGRPFMCSGQAPIVKLGAVGDIFNCCGIDVGVVDDDDEEDDDEDADDKDEDSIAVCG